MTVLHAGGKFDKDSQGSEVLHCGWLRECFKYQWSVAEGKIFERFHIGVLYNVRKLAFPIKPYPPALLFDAASLKLYIKVPEVSRNPSE